METSIEVFNRENVEEKDKQIILTQSFLDKLEERTKEIADLKDKINSIETVFPSEIEVIKGFNEQIERLFQSVVRFNSSVPELQKAAEIATSLDEKINIVVMNIDKLEKSIPSSEELGKKDNVPDNFQAVIQREIQNLEMDYWGQINQFLDDGNERLFHYLKKWILILGTGLCCVLVALITVIVILFFH